MSGKGKKTSVYVGDPIQRVKERLRDANSNLTLSARLNQMAERYVAFVVDADTPHLTQRELNEIRHSLQGMDITPNIIRGLDSLLTTDATADKVERLTPVERLALIERLGL